MRAIEIAIDIGSANTSIFVSGHGVVLHEPTMIAFLKNKKNDCLAIGKEAYKMLGKTPENAVLVSPVVNGVISDPQSMSILLGEFLHKILPATRISPPVKCICSIPLGLSSDQRRAYEEVLFAAYSRVKEISLVENAILSAIGLGIGINTASAALVASIGGGSTEIAAINLSSIIEGCSLTLGGSLMDKAIKEFIETTHGVSLGLSTIKKLKEEALSLYHNDISMRQARGFNDYDGQLTSINIHCAALVPVLEPYYLRVGTAIENIINKCPPDVAGEIYKKGIFIVGGASKILGLSELFYQKQGLVISQTPHPEFAAVCGAGKLLSDKELLKEITHRNRH